jgi:hypothetical protein
MRVRTPASIVTSRAMIMRGTAYQPLLAPWSRLSAPQAYPLPCSMPRRFSLRSTPTIDRKA